MIKTTIIAVLIALIISLSAVYGLANGWQARVILNQQIKISELEIELENRPSEYSVDVEPLPEDIH